MTARGMLRGHPMHWDGERWRYTDTGEPTAETWRTRPCGECGLYPTPEGHDPCLGELPGVVSACCGHGQTKESWVRFETGVLLRGFVVAEGVRG